MQLEPRRDVDRSGAAALERLFDEHHDAVFRFCLARTASADLAEDVTAETFAEAARRYAQSPDPRIGIGWLIEVARRRLIDRWRSDERHRRRIDRFAADLVVRSVDDVDMTGDRVFEALCSLAPRQRAALTLRYLDGYSVAEVAEALECPYRAAESLLARARRSFEVAWKDVS